MNTKVGKRPVPKPTVTTQPFWDGTAQHRLLLARCADCGHARMPPTPLCPCCQSQRIAWDDLSGRGEVYAYTIVERAILPDMDAHLPYVPAVITLDGGGGTRPRHADRVRRREDG